MRLTFSFICTQMTHMWDVHSVGKVYLALLIFLQRSVVPLATPSKFTHNDDYLIMEDESGRVKLIRDANLPSFYVTG
jgi:hypothetical protein